MSDVPPAHINGMLTFDAHGWSGSFSTWQDTGYKIVSFNGIPTTAKPDRGTGLKELRTMLTKIVGGAEKRTIPPVAADGLCAHGAYSNYNDFYEQTPSGPMVNLAGHHWVDLFDMLEDAHGVGMYNNIADGRPVYLVKVAVYCHEEVPVVSLHFMKTLNGGIPETESILVNSTRGRDAPPGDDPRGDYRGLRVPQPPAARQSTPRAPLRDHAPEARLAQQGAEPHHEGGVQTPEDLACSPGSYLRRACRCKGCERRAGYTRRVRGAECIPPEVSLRSSVGCAAGERASERVRREGERAAEARLWRQSWRQPWWRHRRT